MNQRAVAAVQAAVWVASGLWPVVHLRSFEKVTGPKPEGWLVKAMGLLIASVGATLGLAAARDRVNDETAFLGAVAAGSLAAVDVRYAANRRISPIYLLDALLEAAFVGAWALRR
jgi:hypothetical protein